MAKKNIDHKHTLNLSQQALDFYHLQQQVFSAKIVDDKQAYSDTSFDHLIDNLKHHLQFSELILFVEGIASSGKSTLFHRLLKSDIDNILLLPLQAESSDTLTSLQKKIAVHLKSPTDNHDIHEQLKNLQLFDQSAALIIDNAQQLSDECFVEILDFQQQLEADGIHLKLLFFADTGTAAHLIDISYLQENQLFIQLVPELTNKQIAAFIQHCFSHAGYTDAIDLSHEAIIQIEKDSGGNIYQVMQQAVVQIEKHVHKQLAPTSRFNKKLLLPIGFIILLFIIFAAMQTLQQGSSLKQTPAPAFAEYTNKAKALTPAPTSEPLTDNTQALEKISAKNVPQENNVAAQNITIENQPNETPLIENNDTTPTTPQTTDNPTTPAALPAPAVSPAPAAQQKQVQASKPEPEAKPLKTITPTARINFNHPALQSLQQIGIKDGQWLMQQNPKHWTLQVLGAHDPATLLTFAKQQKLTADSAWFASLRNDKAWYVLVHRLYSNRDTARQAIGRLPEGLQKARPWAKSMGSIQKQIKLPDTQQTQTR